MRRESGRREIVSQWLPIIAIAVVQIVLRLINVAGVIWRERARATSHCNQMETAASSGTMLCEIRGKGNALLVIPAPVGRAEPSAGEVASCALPERSPL
jgi:hypothetical protein